MFQKLFLIVSLILGTTIFAFAQSAVSETGSDTGFTNVEKNSSPSSPKNGSAMRPLQSETPWFRDPNMWAYESVQVGSDPASYFTNLAQKRVGDGRLWTIIAGDNPTLGNYQSWWRSDLGRYIPSINEGNYILARKQVLAKQLPRSSGIDDSAIVRDNDNALVGDNTGVSCGTWLLRVSLLVISLWILSFVRDTKLTLTRSGIQNVSNGKIVYFSMKTSDLDVIVIGNQDFNMAATVKTEAQITESATKSTAHEGTEAIRAAYKDEDTTSAS